MEKPIPVTTDMLAGSMKRLGNFFIDNFITTVLHMGLAEAGNRLYATYGQKGFLIGEPKLDNIKFTILGIGITIVYYGLFESVSARTLGKYVTNTMVVNRDGTHPGDGRIFLRTLCRLIPLEILSFIGPVPMGLHDSLSKTVVVDINRFKRAAAKAEATEDNQ